jgi:uncharacterized protein
MKEKNNLLLPFSILSGGLIISVIIFSLVWKSAKADNILTVTGSAKKQIVSDFGIQKGALQANNSDRKVPYQMILSQMPVVLKFLEQKGFQKEQVEVYGITGFPVMEMTANGGQTGRVSYYTYTQRFEIKSNDIQKIKDLSLSLSSLVEKGLDINPEPPEYIYTKLDEIKVQVQAEAAKNAKMRAEVLAKANERDLGLLKDARMGIIQITPKNSNMVTDYGVNDVSSIEKEITAVVSASFQLK